MSRQLPEMMEMHRKQQLMAKEKTAQAALSFDSPPPAKSRKLKSPTATLLLRSRLAQQNVFVSRRNMSKLLVLATLYKEELSQSKSASMK
jgi:hypothetical protein